MDEEPGAPPPHVGSPCDFIKRGDPDTRTFKSGDRVCVRGGKAGKEEVMATVVNATPFVVNVFLDTDFPSKLAKGIDRTKDKDRYYPLPFYRIDVGKSAPNPGPENEDPAGGRRRSAAKRVRNVTRRYRKRKGSRKLRLKFL